MDAGIDAGRPVDASVPPDSAISIACDHTGFTATSASALYSAPNNALAAFAQTTVDAPYDFVGIGLRYDTGAESGPHTHSFTDINLNACHTCSTVQLNCNAANCERTFLAISGTLSVTANGGVGDTFTAKLTNMLYVEVEIDMDTFTSTKVDDGEIWCLDELDVTAPITNAP